MARNDGARIRITKIIAPDKLGKQLERPMRNIANAVGRRMQRLVPKRSWRLHDSIQIVGVENVNGKVTSTVGVGGRTNGVDVDYWDDVERGTSKMAAQPYMRPALLQSKAADLASTTVLAPQHGTTAERREARKADAALARSENAAES